MMTSLALPERRDLMVDLAPRVTLPDFITRASLELIWPAALAFSYGTFQDRSQRSIQLSACLTYVVGTLLGLLVGGHLYALKYETSNLCRNVDKVRSGRRG